MIKKATTVFIILFICCSPKSDLPNISFKVQNLKTFSKIYGYIKYFHPSDEAFALDWDKFSIYAANKILKCETNEAFINTIDSLFSPIAPSIRFANSNGDSMKIENSNNSDVLGEQFWFHKGVGYGMTMENDRYYSQRIIATPENDSISYRPKYGKTANVSIYEGQYVAIPLVVYVIKAGTIPKSNKK